MYRIPALAALLVALIATPALADGPLHQGQQQRVALSFVTGKAPKTIRSTRLVPGSATALQAAATFNGHMAQSCWSDTASQFECAWRGVLIVVASGKKVGHMVVRVVSARYDPVRVEVSLSWSA